MFFKKEINLITWINALTIGWFAGFFMVVFSSELLELIGIEHEQFMLGIAMGAGVSTFEWLALRKHGISARWILLCVLGMSLPFLVQSIFKFELISLNEYAVLPIMIGTGAFITGITQHKLIKSFGIKMSKSVQFTMFAWIIPVILVNGASIIPKDSMPLWLNFLINLAVIIGSGPIYATFKFQILKPVFKNQVFEKIE